VPRQCKCATQVFNKGAIIRTLTSNFFNYAWKTWNEGKEGYNQIKNHEEPSGGEKAFFLLMNEKSGHSRMYRNYNGCHRITITVMLQMLMQIHYIKSKIHEEGSSDSP
jgi:hypothetical protein